MRTKTVLGVVFILFACFLLNTSLFAATTEQNRLFGATWVPNANLGDASRSPGDVNFVIIHSTTEDVTSAINTFTNPADGTSAHFIIGRDGAIYQLVDIEDKAWHAGPEWNAHSVGIELEWIHDNPQATTQNQYDSLAEVLLWLHEQWNIPLVHYPNPVDQDIGSGIIFHREVNENREDPCNYIEQKTFDAINASCS